MPLFGFAGWSLGPGRRRARKDPPYVIKDLCVLCVLEVHAESDPDDPRRQNLRWSQIRCTNGRGDRHSRTSIADVEEIDLRRDLPILADPERPGNADVYLVYVRQPLVTARAEKDSLAASR